MELKKQYKKYLKRMKKMNKSSEIVSFENFTEDIHYDTKYEYIEFKGITCTEGCGELVSTKGEMCGNCAYQLTDDERYLY